jgi:pilus assembly protein FimV
MEKLLRIALLPIFMAGFLLPSMSLAMNEDELGIKVRGPKSSDNFPYDKYGPISNRDTLWNIALRVRPDNRLTIYQVMESLYQENPKSFLDNNVNHLVEGSFLNIPDIEVMFSIDKDTAKLNSENADRVWQKKLPEISKATPAKEKIVNKDDLNLVKTEINQKLETMDSAQQKQLKNIQYDVLNSIDGLEEILKENTSLNERLTSMNEKLANLELEVEQGKALKQQMDDIQNLLKQAQAREQSLIRERQQAELKELQEAELAKEKLTSQTWFIVLVSTLPAFLIIGGLALFFIRNKKPSGDKRKDAKITKHDKKQKEDAPLTQTAEDELDIDLLEDDLSIDLLEKTVNEGADFEYSKEGNTNSRSEPLDELDILEDISVDDALVNQSDELDELDALLDEINAENEEELPTNQQDKEPLDISLENDISSYSMKSPDERDALIDEVNSGVEAEPELITKNESEVNSESELEQSTEEKQARDRNEKSTEEITSLDDIDELLDEVNSGVEAEPELITENESEVNSEIELEQNTEEKQARDRNKKPTQEITSPDDIDELLDEVNSGVEAEPELITENESEVNSEIESEELLDEPLDNTLTGEESDDNEEKISNFIDDSTEPFLDVELDKSDALAESQSDIAENNDIGSSSEEEATETTTESEELQSLDEIDFDDLLASIEDETPQIESKQDETTSTTEDVKKQVLEGTSLELDISKGSEPPSEPKDQERDFVSVESLLSETEETLEEPYKESNIEVGLGNFPDMTKGINKIDVDQDSSIAAKLDLAKVYIEIDDDEHAQLLLDEVIVKGDKEQIHEAKNLLNEL